MDILFWYITLLIRESKKYIFNSQNGHAKIVLKKVKFYDDLSLVE